MLEQFGAQQQGISTIKLFTPVKTTTLNYAHKRPTDPKWSPEVSSSYDLDFNSIDRGGNNCSYKTCQAAVKMSLPTNQHPVFTGRMPFALTNEQCQITERNKLIQQR